MGLRWITPSTARRLRPFWRRTALIGFGFLGAAFIVFMAFTLLTRYLSVHGLDDLASAEDLIESFDRVMHTSDHQPLTIREPLRKWTGDIPIFFDASVPGWHRSMAERQLPLIARLIGLRFILTKAYDRRSTLNIVLAEDTAAMRKEARRFTAKINDSWRFDDYFCFAIVTTTPNGTIQGALAVFGEKRQSTKSHSCLIEELLHGLGPNADKATYAPSIFNKFTFPVEIPLNDQILIRTLYDPKIKPGMSSEQTRKLVPDIIRGLIEDVKAHGPEALYQH
ncbi:MAG: DUF2927 domain-containing protein [Alphaproteobacteria bacterium]